MINIIDKINEFLKQKPSFDDWLNNKKNYKKIRKVFDLYYSDYATEEGQDIIDNEEDSFFEEDSISAYEDNAHNLGYIAEYNAAMDTIKKLKNDFDYKRGDEKDEEKQYKLAEKMGYRPSFR